MVFYVSMYRVYVSEMSVSDTSMKIDLNGDESGNLHLLSVDENYYSTQHEVWNMENANDIQLAIDTCKDSILALEEISEEKRLLVQRLVKLRLRLQEVQEFEIYMDPKKMKVVLCEKKCFYSNKINH